MKCQFGIRCDREADRECRSVHKNMLDIETGRVAGKYTTPWRPICAYHAARIDGPAREFRPLSK